MAEYLGITGAPAFIGGGAVGGAVGGTIGSISGGATKLITNDDKTAIAVGGTVGAVTGGLTGGAAGNYIIPGAGVYFGASGGMAAGGYCGAKGTKWFCEQ